jgi:transcriptional regulator GlxA family with amidase domain
MMVGMERRIAILVMDGYSDSGLSVALDVFRAANSLASRAGKPAPFALEVLSPRGGGVRAASGLALGQSLKLARARFADVVMMAGVWVETPAQLDRVLASEDARLLVGALAAAHARGALVAAACCGSFFLAAAGLLDGRDATTTWWLAAHLAARYPAVRVDASHALVVDGPIITAGAVFAQADVALTLVARFAGPSLARQCARVLLLDTHASQAPYMALEQLRSNDRTVRRAETWVRAHLDEEVSIPALARQVGVSTRTLARRLDAAVGLSPLAFIQRLRVEAAVQLLRTTRLSLVEIGARVGYSDPGSLRRLVQRETRATPRQLRTLGQPAARR